MYKREMYLQQIRPFYRNEQIKILSGVRRSGKTELLKAIQAEIKAEESKAKIHYFSFELLENRKYRDGIVLYAQIKKLLNDDKFHYLFLDEIQFVENWPEVVNSIKTKYKNVSIFLTGSNSKLLADDKESVLGGRTILFRVMPFSFAEFHNYRTELNDNVETDKEGDFNEYLKWGGFPLIFSEQEEDRRMVMLESIFDSIVLRDIVRRRGLRNSFQLEQIIDYVISSTGSYISGRNISERMEKAKEKLSLPKVLDYLKAIEESCIVDIVPRFDVIGLNTLEFNNKGYACDPAFVNYKKSLISDLYGSLYETIVYNDLIARGYQVKTGTARGKEIDFVASKGAAERIYVQVAYEVNEDNRQREFGNFDAIDDNYPKYVVSKDKVLLSVKGIKHVNIIDFLLRNEEERLM